jgi:hypothetical protein
MTAVPKAAIATTMIVAVRSPVVPKDGAGQMARRPCAVDVEMTSVVPMAGGELARGHAAPAGCLASVGPQLLDAGLADLVRRRKVPAADPALAARADSADSAGAPVVPDAPAATVSMPELQVWSVV